MRHRRLLETLTMGFLSGRRMSGVLTLFMAFAMVNHGSMCKILNRPECFRAESLNKNADYRCEWKPSEATRNTTYQLFIRTVTPKYHLKKYTVTIQNYKEVNGEEIITKRGVDIWVVADMDDKRCRSPNNTNVVLEETVKYETPQNISMARSSRSLVIQWRSVEGKGDVIEVTYRRQEDPGTSWNTEQISTNKTSDKTVSITLDLQKQSVYQVMVRQRSRHVENPLWSDWSPVLDVPTEIPNPPQANMEVEDLYNGTRSLKLTWEENQYPVSAGNVSYHLSLHNWPCQRKWKNVSNRMVPEFSTSVTYSAVNLSITAVNKVGKSPATYFLVPAQHLKTCDKPAHQEPAQQNQGFKKACLEWYMLTDGETRPATVNISNGTLMEIKQKMHDYVRYYYFRHNHTEGKPKTTEMCPIYKQEGAPSKAPQEFSAFNVTHNSVVLYWKPIPVAEQRGFLKHYEVCFGTNINQTDCHNVSESHTEYPLQNLKPDSIYKISLAGATVAGSGPKATVDIKTLSQPINDLKASFALQYLYRSCLQTHTTTKKRIRAWMR